MFPDFMTFSCVAVAVDDKFIVAAAACPDRSAAFPRPFRILAVTTGRGELTEVA